MKRTEFKPCAGCGKGVMHTGSPVFYRIRIAIMGADLAAIRRAHGLELTIGNAAIAHVMGPDEDLATIIDETDSLVCLDCAIRMPLAALMEAAAEQQSTGGDHQPVGAADRRPGTPKGGEDGVAHDGS